jgi:hypothetical protein
MEAVMELPTEGIIKKAGERWRIYVFDAPKLVVPDRSVDSAWFSDGCEVIITRVCHDTKPNEQHRGVLFVSCEHKPNCEHCAALQLYSDYMSAVAAFRTRVLRVATEIGIPCKVCSWPDRSFGLYFAKTADIDYYITRISRIDVLLLMCLERGEHNTHAISAATAKIRELGQLSNEEIREHLVRDHVERHSEHLDLLERQKKIEEKAARKRLEIEKLKERIAAGEEILLCSDCGGTPNEELGDCKCAGYSCCDMWMYDGPSEICEFCGHEFCPICGRTLPQDCGSAL